MADDDSLSRGTPLESGGENADPDAVTLYVVDSSPDDLARLLIALRQAGFGGLGCATAEELLDRFEDRGATCVVTELELPGVGGLELQARLRARSPHTTFVFFTRSPDVGSAVAALRGGAHDYLEKHWLGSAVADRVRAALAESKRRLGAASSGSAPADRRLSAGGDARGQLDSRGSRREV